MDEILTEVSNPKGYAITHDLNLAAPISKVFESITAPDHLINWWPLECSEKGGNYNFYFTPEYDWYGKVIKLVKNKAFYIKMTQSDADWNPTSFGFDLENKDNQVRVMFWHKGWPARNEHFRRSSFCWAMLLNGLKNYVEKGAIVPFEERQ